MNAEKLIFEWLYLSVLIRENSSDSWIESQQRGSEVQVHAGLSTVPTIEPGSRDNFKSTGREFRRHWRGQSFAFEQPANGGGKECGQFRPRGGIPPLGQMGLHQVDCTCADSHMEARHYD
jgi:hypothetical protein